MVEMGMVERVARALARLSDDLGYDEEKWLYCVPDARAAIEAMREPTPSMLAECWPLHHPWGANAPKPEERPEVFRQMTENVRVDWQAMIDAALTPSAAPSPIPGPSENTGNTSAQPRGE